MADTDFVKVPLEGLTSKPYAISLASKIDMEKPMESVSAGDRRASNPARQFNLSVMDSKGNMVRVTESINYFFGSRA